MEVDSRSRPSSRARTRTRTAGGAPRGRRRGLIEAAFVFVGCVLLLDALVGEKGLVEILRARQEYRALEQTLADARAENARMREEIRRLSTDADAVEDLARRELGLIKPGEKLFTIRDVDPAEVESPD